MIVRSLLLAKCPHCQQGSVFADSNLFHFSLGKMYSRCPVCNYNLAKEPGYYWGAMYASYGLGIVEMLLVYLVCRLLGTGTFDWVNLWAMCLVVLILSPFNFKFARILWLYIFP